MAKAKQPLSDSNSVETFQALPLPLKVIPDSFKASKTKSIHDITHTQENADSVLESVQHIPIQHRIPISSPLLQDLVEKNQKGTESLSKIIDALGTFAKDKLADLESDSTHLNEEAAQHGLNMIFSCCKIIQDQLDPENAEKFRKSLMKKTAVHSLKSKLGSLFYTKPRGYAGDFEMMESIWEYYQSPLFKNTATNTQEHFDKFFASRKSCQAVPWRVHFLKKVIQKTSSGNIASIGCGPAIELRELAKENQLQQKTIHLFDQDKEALAFSKSSLEALGIQASCFPGNIFKTMFGMQNNHYQLIYSSGLFDYIPLDKAQRLVKSLFNKLLPGGTLLITNAGIENPTRFYKEALFDWFLDHKSSEDMHAIAKDIKAPHSIKLETDPYKVFQYLLIQS